MLSEKTERSVSAIIRPPRSSSFVGIFPRGYWSGIFGCCKSNENLSSNYAAVILSVAAAGTSRADEFTDLFNRVEKLNIRRNDYTLGKVLTDKQKTNSATQRRGKGRPGNLQIQRQHSFHSGADKATDRVLVLYERYEPVSRKKIRELVGALFFDFGDPTVMAHDKTIYWAFDEKGKISEEQYREAKATKKNR